MTTQIRELFDPNKDIYRAIEKVITYAASQESRLKAEISEYVVTSGIEDQFRKLLEKMQLAMDTGGQNEIGVWVSGFYGSGKSSFTKYLGLAFDNSIKVDGVSFLEHLQNRLSSPQVKALLATTVKKFPAAIVMLDLASEMLAGATMEPISTVLYLKVLQWAGYSRNLKIAALERKIEKDGRKDEFEKKIEELLPGTTWKQLQNDPLIVDELIPSIAHEMYPAYFSSANSFSSNTQDFFQFEDQRVQEMIEIVRNKSGKQYVIFVIDEVGQYIASRDSLILNLDGLAKNLKRLGDGKVWVVSTAQQTLTEDDPRAQLNSGKLYKLKDRFPIQIDLESSDIKEICYRRLLGKSPHGKGKLTELFSTHGQALRHNTKLQDAKYYDSDFDSDEFIKLYPFLPAHFDILLHLLGALAKSTGGIGLRSAIKVIQDILVEGGDGRSPAADHPIGWLATTVTLYDTLEKDIRRAFPSIHQAVQKTCIIFHGSQLHQEIAKSIAVLQILSNLPVTVQNIASLMHPAVNHQSRHDEIHKVIDEMLNKTNVPLSEQDGNLCFLSEKLVNVEEERGNIPLRSIDMRRIFNECVRLVFEPLPKTNLFSVLTITAGLKIQANSNITSLAGEQNDIQIVVEFVAPTDYETTKSKTVDDSRHRANQNNIFLIGQNLSEIENLVGEIYRCQRIEELHRNDLDQEIKQYCNSQIDRATKLFSSLQQKLKNTLSQGSFIFRGQITAVSALNQNLIDAAKKLLANVAELVFERYGEAPERVDTSLAEKFLRLPSLSAITSAIDPLSLVETSRGRPNIKTTHKAIVSIKDFINKTGSVEGKALLKHFSEAPFGWSQDTVRYILAAMLFAGEIKLKFSAHEITTIGQQAIDVLKNNKSFGNVGVSLRNERPSMDVLARASERLTELAGEDVDPLEQEITKLAAKYLVSFQYDYAPLSEKLKSLSLGGVDRMYTLNTNIKDILSNDASDAPQCFGSVESLLYKNLKWAAEIKREFNKGLEQTIRELHKHSQEIQSLPSTGIFDTLRQELLEDSERVSQLLKNDDFYQYAVDLNSSLTNIKAKVQGSVEKLIESQKNSLKEGAEELSRMPEWIELTQEEKSNILNQIESTTIEASKDLEVLKALLSKSYDINTSLSNIKSKVKHEAGDRVRQRIKKANSEEKSSRKFNRSIPISPKITTITEMDELIRQLQEIKAQMALYSEIEVTISIKE